MRSPIRIGLFLSCLLLFHGTASSQKKPAAPANAEKTEKMIDDAHRGMFNSATGNEKSLQSSMSRTRHGAGFRAVQFVGAYMTRKDNRRWMAPGSAFFQIQDGKIRGARFYIPLEETMEVFNR